MGTTTLMAMSDILPDMKEKIILANLLAPVAFVEHMRSPIALIAPFANIIEVMQILLAKLFSNETLNIRRMEMELTPDKSNNLYGFI